MLAVKIRSNNSIKGLEIRGLKTKVSLYTDDSCFLLKPQLQSLHGLIDLDTFAVLSGIKPNYDKCITYWITKKMKMLHYCVVYQLNGLTEMWKYSVYKSQKKEIISLQYIFIES